MGDRITLSTVEFAVLWDHLRLGDIPAILDILRPGGTAAERAKRYDQGWASLTDRHLAWPNRIDDRLESRLRRIAAPETELDLRLRPALDQQRSTALIAGVRRAATIAIRGGDGITLGGARADQVPAAAARLLTEHPPGTGGSITLPAGTLDEAASGAGDNPDALRRKLISAGLGKTEARKITDVLGAVVRFGHFGAARTSDGWRRRAGHVVSVYDTPPGRYLFTRKNGWVTLVPGTEQAITRQLTELLDTL